jgi:hypothetical protein
MRKKASSKQNVWNDVIFIKTNVSICLEIANWENSPKAERSFL